MKAIMGMEGNFEQFNNSNNHLPHFNSEEMRVRLNVDEIMGQLNVTTDRYEDELEKLKAGEDVDREWLGNYQGNLIDWMNAIKMTEGTLRRGNEEVLNEVERRLFLISEEMERIVH